MSNAAPTLADLVGAPVDVPVGGIKIKIQPLGWYESVGALDCIAPALATMPTPPAQGEQVALEPWLIWLGANRDSVVTFLNATTGQPGSVISQLSPMHLVELLFGVMEVNADFFVASLPSAISGLVTRGQALIERVKAVNVPGLLKQAQNLPAPSPSSSSTATATPT